MGQTPALYAPWVNALARKHWRGADGTLHGPRPALVLPLAALVSKHDTALIVPERMLQAVDQLVAYGADASTLIDALERCGHGVVVPWSAADIASTARAFDLTPWGVPPGGRVALLLPNGPQAALALLATMCRYTAIPLDPNAPAAATADALRRLNVCAVLAPAAQSASTVLQSASAVLQSASPVLQRAAAAAGEVGVPHVPLGTTPATLLPPCPPPTHANNNNKAAAAALSSSPPPPFLGPTDTVLVLSTSGTTGVPKAVPFSLARLLASGRALAASMGLGTGDVGLNMGMPLHHVGGTSRHAQTCSFLGGTTAQMPPTDRRWCLWSHAGSPARLRRPRASDRHTGIACNLIAPLLSRGRMVYEGAFAAEAWLQVVLPLPHASRTLPPMIPTSHPSTPALFPA